MKSNIFSQKKFFPGVCVLSFFIFATPLPGFSYPLNFQDADHRHISITEKPERIVSLLPAVTELIFAIGAGDCVKGLTYHDRYPRDTVPKALVGGFFSPSPELIGAENPEIIFISDLHKEVIKNFADQPLHLIRLPLHSLTDLYETIRLLGQIFHKEENAAALSAKIRAELELTAKKTAGTAPEKKKRVIRLMGRNQVMTAGDDSFQNEIIRLAGGIPPKLGKKGKTVPITLEEWKAFNPQVIYGCEGDRKIAEKMLTQPGWKSSDAVKKGKIYYYPCDLTCRLSSRTAYFVSCLSSRIYGEIYEKSAPVIPDGIVSSKTLSIDLPYVASAEILNASLYDFIHKTLLIGFRETMAVSSTLEGFRENIRYVGNSYSPPQVWDLYHRIGLGTSRQKLLDIIEKDPKESSLLFTGADMDNLSVQMQSHKEMKVCALVTAGVESNALRMSQDTGAYYEPGTINIILMSNMKLSPRAMNRAIISATEAKTAALWDMDIRSTQSPLPNPATGTGTDNIIVVQGEGMETDNTGGHSKMGELIAGAVYAGVQDAVFKQNAIMARRNIFQRLKERHIRLYGLAVCCDCGLGKGDIAAALEKLLLQDRYAGFMETALAVSDAYERGLIRDLSAFQSLCEQISEEISGGKMEKGRHISLSESLPPVIETAFRTLLKAVTVRNGNIKK
jgi:ABC-type Fe3+-hydroxamate transport system substrate-binding protein/adenosylcobinamide amidohydrolase